MEILRKRKEHDESEKNNVQSRSYYDISLTMLKWKQNNRDISTLKINLRLHSHLTALMRKLQ